MRTDSAGRRLILQLRNGTEKKGTHLAHLVRIVPVSADILFISSRQMVQRFGSFANLCRELERERFSREKKQNVRPYKCSMCVRIFAHFEANRKKGVPFWLRSEWWLWRWRVKLPLDVNGFSSRSSSTSTSTSALASSSSVC